MARTISDENLKFNIIINGDPAQKELLDLEKSTRSLTKTNKELIAERKKLAAAGKKESAEYKNLSKEIKTNNATLAANKTKMAQLQKEIGLTGLTMAQLTKKANILRSQLRHTIPGGEAEKKYKAELLQVQNRLDQLKGKANQTKLSLSSLANGFNKYAALGATVIATGTGMVLSLQKMVDYNGKLSDAQADVMKTTGQTKEEVDELTKSFGALITRTSRLDLLKIAEEGGRIGIAKQDIGEFVEVMNKANVALGDSFTGGVEEVASKLGKLKLLFGETKDIGVDQAYNAIGSAINELGANGVATEVNIANFATRVGSLPDAIKPSISQALALGAAFEESGIQSEIAGRGYNIFLKQASSNSDKFAKVMGITTQEVENMINTNPTNFFLEFSEGLKGMNATETANTLKELGLNAEGTNKIVGAAGNNIDRFRELLDLSNTSMLDASSLTDEYNIKNNNLAATLDKVKKKMFGWFSSEGLVAWLTAAVAWFADFIGATEQADEKTSVWRETLVFTAKILAVVTAALISNVAWQKLVVLWTTRGAESNILYTIASKARAFAEGVGTVATQAYAVATMLMTGNLVGATQAFRVMTAAMMTTPWGFIIGAVAAIGAAYVVFSDEAREAATSQSLLNDATVEASKNINTEKEELKLLLKIARDETQSKKERQKAIDELNKRVPEYNNNLTIESAKTLEATNTLNKYIEAKEREILADILLNDWKKKLAAQKDAENSSLEENINWLNRTWNAMKTGGQFFAMQRADIETAIENKQQLIEVTKEEAALAKQLYEDQLRLNSANSNGNNSPTGPTEGDTQEINGVTFVFKGGKWQKLQTYTPKGDGDKLSPEDQAIVDSKKKLAEFLEEFEADQALKAELAKFEKEQQAEQEELIRMENKFQKMAEEAGFETILAAGLEEAKEAKLNEIREKYAAKKLKDKEINDKKYEALEAKHKAALIKVDEDLERAKTNFYKTGLTSLASFFGKKTALYKIMFGLEKALAISDVVINTSKALGLITSSTAAANAKAVLASPLTGGMPWVAINTALATKQALTAKLNAAAQIGTIAGTAIQGFEDGLYGNVFPVTRAQDGKQFNASYGGQTTSGMVTKPTVFMAGENGPELIVDAAAHKQIDPSIKYAFHREIARVKGFESGYYPQNSNSTAASNNTTETQTTNSDALLIAALHRNSQVLEKIEELGVIATVTNKDLKAMKYLKEGIDDYNSLRTKNQV